MSRGVAGVHGNPGKSAGIGKNAVVVATDLDLERPVRPTQSVGDAAPVRQISRKDGHSGRREVSRSRRTLAVACLVTAGIPIALIISLWRNLKLPFWYNEQWRAYYISKPGDWWSALKTDGGPFPAGWYFLERASASLFGSTELVLRIPVTLFLPLTCVLLLLLARRWMPLVPAVVVALVGGLTGTLVSFAVQLSEYQIDAAAVVALLLLYDVAASRERRGWSDAPMWLAYGGIALACVFSTPAIFVAGPVLLLDVFRQARDRSLGARTVGAVAAGAIALAHIEFFVAPQNALTKSNYWDPNFAPHHGISSQIAFVWDGLRGFITGTLLGANNPDLPELLNTRWSWLVSLIFGLLLCAGIVATARSLRGRTLLAAIGGSLGVTLVASYVRYWPFGFVRTNFYLVPLLILLAGIGAVSVTRVLAARIRTQDEGASARWNPSLVARGAVAVVAVAAIVAGVALAATYEAGSYEQIRDSASYTGWGATIDSAVAAVKEQAKPGDDLVVAGVMAVPGWEYYQDEYSGLRVPPGGIDVDRSYFTAQHGSPAITRLIAHTDPGHVFLYVPDGTPLPDIDRDIDAIRAGASCHQVDPMVPYSVSGLLFRFACGPK
jgi:hypothetical protein